MKEGVRANCTYILNKGGVQNSLFIMFTMCLIVIFVHELRMRTGKQLEWNCMASDNVHDSFLSNNHFVQIIFRCVIKFSGVL